MKLREHLKLRKVGRKYMIVNTGAGCVNLTDVFTLNETAADLWQQAEKGEFTIDDLTNWLCETYDVDVETARMDVKHQLEEWKRFGLIE